MQNTLSTGPKPVYKPIVMKQTKITKEFLDFFEIQLKDLLLELFDIDKEFIEKEI